MTDAGSWPVRYAECGSRREEVEVPRNIVGLIIGVVVIVVVIWLILQVV